MDEKQGNRWVQSIEVEALEPMKVAYYRAMATEPEDEGFRVLIDWATKCGHMDRPGKPVFGFNNPR